MTSAGTTQSVLSVTDMTAAKVLSTPNGYHEENFTTTDDSAKDFQLNKFNPTANTTQNNLTTKIITIIKLSTDVKNVTEDIVSLPTAAFTPKACLHSTQEEENIVFRYIRELCIAILVFLLVLVFAAFLRERKKRLKQQREHSYIFTLPPNTELNNIRESNVFYHTTLDFSNLFIDDRAERLSSCIYQDITDLVPMDNLVSPRSTYQQIPVNLVNTEDVE
ncbi:uncharacterized protein LOC134267806 [Saccostrea cucullata]|uniref:uncharacterized protein LOC134267806 n=1 Tax=Saccostrea cuccullata TaxID=36930 RepID=UPI002ED245DC